MGGQGQTHSKVVADSDNKDPRFSGQTDLSGVPENRLLSIPTHSRTAECGNRQAAQARPHHSNRVVSPPRVFPGNMEQVAATSDRPICYEVQQQTHRVCITSTRSPGLGRDTFSLPCEDLDPYVFPPDAILGTMV